MEGVLKSLIFLNLSLLSSNLYHISIYKYNVMSIYLMHIKLYKTSLKIDLSFSFCRPSLGTTKSSMWRKQALEKELKADFTLKSQTYSRTNQW